MIFKPGEKGAWGVDVVLHGGGPRITEICGIGDSLSRIGESSQGAAETGVDSRVLVEWRPVMARHFGLRPSLSLLERSSISCVDFVVQSFLGSKLVATVAGCVVDHL